MQELITEPKSAPDLVLVGCGKAKRDEMSEARDLYTSTLFAKRRTYAEASGAPWRILTAHGAALFEPDDLVGPYDREISRLGDLERERWSAALERRIDPLLDSLDDGDGQIIIEVHAGRRYAEAFVEAAGPALLRHRCRVIHPVGGLQIGEQLAWYTRQE